MDQVESLLEELRDVRRASSVEVCQAVLAAFWRRSTADLDALAARFTEAKFDHLAGMCREIRFMKARPN